MFIGHLGAAMALKRADKRINLGWLALASMLPDILLWAFVLVGWEQVIVPDNYPQLHYLRFVFPHSHSLVAALLWSALTFAVVWLVARGTSRTRSAVVLASAVFAHFLCDLLEHPPQLPLTGHSSTMLGLGLWNHMYAALGVELLLVIVGFVLYFKSTHSTGFLGRYGLLILMALIGVTAIGGQLAGPPPSSTTQLALSSLITILVVVLLFAWLDKKRKAL